MAKSMFGIVAAAHRQAVAKAAEHEIWKDLADELKRVGSFEKLAAEAEAKKARAEGDLAAVENKIEAALSDLAGAQKNAEHQREANARAEADHRDALERIKADGIEAGKRAAAEANRIVEDARRDADQLTAAADGIVAGANAKLAGIVSEIDAAKAELAEILKRKDEALAELDRLKTIFGGKA